MNTSIHSVEQAAADEQARGARSAAGAADSPRSVIRGESSPNNEESQGAVPRAALTDWLNLSFDASATDSLLQFVCRISEASQEGFGGLTPRGRGLHGYTESFAFDRGGVLLGRGGQRGTAFLSIPGEGCALIRDWDGFTRLLRDELAAKITRWDGAADDFLGAHSVDTAVELYRAGGFNCGGRKPSCKQYGNWIEPDGTGRTFQVGSRKNGKVLRVYEKGMQLGCPFHPWVRWEVELHSRDRFIPFDVLLAPGAFVAGAYPCLGWVQEEASRIRTVKAQDAIGYERLTTIASRSYGALVNVMLEREGSPERVVALLNRPGAVPRRLAFTDDYLKDHRDES